MENQMEGNNQGLSCGVSNGAAAGTVQTGMNERIKRLRQQSYEAEPSLSIERALIETEFYKENYGKYPIPVLRAKNFYEICRLKTAGIRFLESNNGKCGVNDEKSAGK